MIHVNVKSLRKSLKMRQGEFGDKMNISQSYLSEIETGKKPLTQELYDTLVEAFGESVIKDFTEDKTLDNTDFNANLVSDFEIQYVPLVNQYAYAGYMDGYCDVTFMEQLPKVPFIVDREGRGNYVAFEIKGDSMDDGSDEGYKEGETILCREIPPHLWVTSKLHLKKWDFVIVHKEGIIIKRIMDHNVENQTITIHSLNDFYPDKVIHMKDIKQIFNVILSTKSRRR